MLTMTRRLLIAAIDRYRARVAPHCTVCQSDPAASASYRVRDRVATQGVTAGVLLFVALWLDRFSRGGW